MTRNYSDWSGSVMAGISAQRRVSQGRETAGIRELDAATRRARVETTRVENPVGGEAADVAMNVRESTIGYMHARGRLTDVQKATADRFRGLAERAQAGGVKAIDYSKVRVDCGSAGASFDETALEAQAELANLMVAIGRYGFSILFDIVVEGHGIDEASTRWSQTGGSVTGNRAKGYVTARLVEGLDQLHEHWDTIQIATGKPKQQIRAWRKEEPQAFVEWLRDRHGLYRLIEQVKGDVDGSSISK